MASDIELAIRRPELLAPAGDIASVHEAVRAGADAVYVGAGSYSLRGKIPNLCHDDLVQAVAICHDRGRRLYLAINVAPRDEDFAGLRQLLDTVSVLSIDALIVWDPGVIAVVREVGLHTKLHLSTMACTLNLEAVKFWAAQGIARVNLARELTYEEVRYIARRSPISVEVFIHGSVCISYAGRCVLSNYLRHRDTHRGLCATPCRWEYAVLRPSERGGEEAVELHEADNEAYVLNSRNLCLIARIPQLVRAGVSALKIEGRQQDAAYVGSVTSVYRTAIDAYMEEPAQYAVRGEWLDALAPYGRRGYWEGLMFEPGGPESQNFQSRGPSAKRLRTENADDGVTI